jgi:hypothetical protein
MIFYEILSQPCSHPQFAMFNIAEAYSFSGILIATSLETAQKLISFPCCSQKYFYSFDLFWLRGNYRPYGFFRSIYCHPEIKLIARSEPHYQAIKNCWNKEPVGIVDNFNMKQLLKLIS